MSVYCDKIVGYTLDVTKDFENANRESIDKWLDYCENNKDLYSKLSFKTYWGFGQKQISSGDITLIYDGMSGQYCKLVLIEEYVYKSDCEEQDDGIVVAINEKLNQVEIDSNIKEKLQLAYESIFGNNENIIDKIKLEYFIHWH